MIDFKIEKSDFRKASQLMTRARTSAADEIVVITCTRGNVRFLITGREDTCSAQVDTTGQAQLPATILPKLVKVAATFPEGKLRIRVGTGQIKINSMSFTSSEITVSEIMDRPIDIPDDAPVRDILALKFLFTPDEITASDLATRFLAANSQRAKAIESAASLLGDFGVPSETVEHIVEEALRSNAEQLRPMLKPPLSSNRPN